MKFLTEHWYKIYLTKVKTRSIRVSFLYNSHNNNGLYGLYVLTFDMGATWIIYQIVCAQV